METYKDTISGETLYVQRYSDGDVYYYKDEAMNILHRVDGPAKEYSDGDKFWMRNNKLHRLDGPAVEWTGGDKNWYIDGEGIAFVYSNTFYGPLQQDLAELKSN
jgi:hypothetical protein